MNFFRKLRWSIALDSIVLFKIRGIALRDALYFIAIKYFVFLKDGLTGLRKAPLSIDIFDRKFFYNNLYGPASLQRVYSEGYYLRDFVKPGAVIIDVGAHIGQFNFFCDNYLGAERIISIEPLKDCFLILRRNARRPDDCINLAVSVKEGPITFYIAKASSQLSSYIKDSSEDYGEEIVVQAKRLDDIIEELSFEKIDLLKIDTEGSEYEVLLSAQGILHKCDALLIEMSVARNSSGDLFAVGSYLNSQGFKLAKLLPYSTGQRSIDGIFTRKN